MYGYYWEFTDAQIELMISDCPVIVYNSDRKKKKRGKNEDFRKANAADINSKIKQWEEKYKNKEEGITLDLGGFL